MTVAQPSQPCRNDDDKMTTTIDSIRIGSHLGLRFRAIASAAVGRPIHVGILCDNSGSMNGERLDAVKRTLRAARDLFRTGDTLTLVTFSDAARVVLQAHALDSDEAITAAYTAIDAIHTEGSTNLSAGIERLYSITTNYDAVILLTDGIVNAGITNPAGLLSMAQVGSTGRTRVFHALGYGADHNRVLLRDLAIKSRGTYTYIDSEEILPIAIGDVISGLRAEVVRGLRVRLPADCGWRCMEAGAVDDTEYFVGSLVADRDYWAIFRWAGAGAATAEASLPFRATLEEVGVEPRDVSIDGITELGEMHVMEQVLRARVSRALETMSSQMEGAGAGAGRGSPDLTELRALQTEISALPEELRVRGLMLRLQAQVAEALDLAARVTRLEAEFDAAAPALRGGGGAARAPLMGGLRAGMPFEDPAATRTHLMARLSSGAACLTNQRGVYSMASTDPTDTTSAAALPGRAPALMESVSLFSTPSQRSASSAVRANTQRPPVQDDQEDSIN